MNIKNPNQSTTENIQADPAELNAEDLELLNDGALQQVVGGGLICNGCEIRVRPR
jgi:hypothetical protein